MAYERLSGASLDYLPCRYGKSRLLFRGPRRRLDGCYAAFLGGIETYGRFVARPFPALVEEATGVKCVNFGCAQAGPDVFLNDSELIGAAGGARLAVLQLPPATNLSNRFYTVHPRRNDRFVEASDLLQTVFRDVDFTEVHFTGHLLARLQATSPERFRMVRDELETAWVVRMKQLIERIGVPTVLLWMQTRPGPASDPGSGPAEAGAAPAFVTAEMVETLREKAASVVTVCPSEPARADGTRGMVFGPVEAPIAARLPGPAVHRETAVALAPVVSELAGRT
ncbi:DUF6473 family protein [Roseovarius salinarum]|uniref:DUF6473 family protein n=1 Tax=Roseovarius salinarum TaxID=1981892 RepID=UPI000C34DB6A|nr:DUF6473 family protein [Roseovarius salinarum]